MRYSLANYSLSIKPNDASLQQMFPNIVIGGQRDAYSSVTISLDQNLWAIDDYATGAYVFNKNCSKSGSVTVSISQLSENVNKFKKLCEQWLSNEEYNGLTLSLTSNDGNQVCSCIDCYIEKVPDQVFGETSGDQDWKFLCGEINFN